MTEDSIFNNFLENFESKDEERWSYEKANELESIKHRENYLNIQTQENSENNSVNDVDISAFTGIPPDIDILPQTDYSGYESILNKAQNKYVRLTIGPYELQIILRDFTTNIQLYKKGISGFDVVKEKSVFFSFEKIMKIEPLDSPFKYPLIDNTNGKVNQKIEELVTEAIYCCNPISMEYQDAKFDILSGNITWISFAIDSEITYGDKIWANYYRETGSMIVAYCLLRESQRHFYINRIKSIKVFNLRDFSPGIRISFGSSLWYPLEKNDFELSNHISNLIPKYYLENDLICAGNYAHFLFLTGKKEKALNIYKQHVGKLIKDEMNWQEMILQDFKDLKDISDYGDKFEEAKQLLSW